MRTTCPPPSNIIILHLITLIISEEYKSWSSTLWRLIHSPVTSYNLGPNIFLNTSFQKVLILYSIRTLRHQASIHVKRQVFYFCCSAKAEIGPRLPLFEVSKSHTLRHTHPVGILWTSDQLVAEAATYTTQQTQETNFHALSGIRTRDPSNRAAADVRCIPHGYRDRQAKLQFFVFWSVWSEIKRKAEIFWSALNVYMSIFLICERNVCVMSLRTTGLCSLVLWTVKRSCVKLLLSRSLCC
jgi:hypothetical protein